MQFFLVAAAVLLGSPDRIIDADTLVLEGTRVRLWGIQAPERRETCTRPGQAAFNCDILGSSRLESLTAGGVECEEKDVDRYGRTVALCRSAAGDVSRILVQEGLALAYRRFSRDYVKDEEAARDAGVGLWSCEIQAPPAWQKRKSC